jgi:RNA polymerase sigma-70 factor (ECF subfamily)
MSKSLNITSLQNQKEKENHPLTFASVFDKYQQPIYNDLLRLTQNRTEAEDLTQETFIRVHRKLSTFRGEAKLDTWLYRIATNISFDYFRRYSTHQAKASLPFEETDRGGEMIFNKTTSSPELLVAQSEMSTCVERFIQRLPPDHRVVLVLHELQGLKISEIADVLDCSLSTVKIRLHRARKKLRETLNAGCDFNNDERIVFVCEPKKKEVKSGLL